MYHANTRINRNLKQRIELASIINQAIADRDWMYDSIQSIEDDDAYDEAFKDIHDRYDTEISTLMHRADALEYPESRNEWFKRFFESFGLCECKAISYKQVSVFIKYAEQSHNEHYSERYYVRVGNRIAQISYYGIRPGYLTITEY